MKSLFAATLNAIPLSEDQIPVLEIETWRQTILNLCHEEKGRIVALCGGPQQKETLRLFAVVGVDSRKTLWVGATDLPKEKRTYSSLTPDLPEAQWFERELFEQWGIDVEGHPWLKPIRRYSYYSFYKIEGSAIHEVAVGPVHAGIIEPGHFRFQCHGEKVLHLEIQLGYQHRGVENLLVQSNPSQRLILAESIAGDTVIGHGMAYCQAIEGLSNRSVPPRAHTLRAMALELERLSNHTGDLGALAADIGFLPASAYFGRIRGEFLNLLMELSGNRFGRSLLKPGGVLFDLPSERIQFFEQKIAVIQKEIKELAELFFTASSVLARLEQTGTIKMETAQQLGLVGPTARASNLLRDVRQDYPSGPFRAHTLESVRLTTGDVYARARVRSLESKRSLVFLQEQLGSLPSDKTFQPCGKLKPTAMIVSLIEGWRGEIAHILWTNENGEISHYKVIDPSFHNWMALSVAMQEGQISDFPLCNKSFNLSYAGHDL